MQRSCSRRRDGGARLQISPRGEGHPVMTDADVRSALEAVEALRAAVEVLLVAVGIDPEEILQDRRPSQDAPQTSQNAMKCATSQRDHHSINHDSSSDSSTDPTSGPSYRPQVPGLCRELEAWLRAQNPTAMEVPTRRGRS